MATTRLPQWIAGFHERHGGSIPAAPRPRELIGADGTLAQLHYFDHDPLGVILVRRGGYAVARLRGGKMVLHKVGTRYVQSRTAAGGWSQQRFARRRDNQADELVTAVADHAARILIDLASSATDETGEIPVGRTPYGPGVIVGGDRQLVAQVLSDRRLATLRDLPRRALYDLGDPNRAVLEAAIKRGTAVRVAISEHAVN
ncbi:MAG: acVLRF1 family peptidyl-tRNA hydrolase [Tetrasphaera sp.]